METGACTPHKQERRACRQREERKGLPTRCLSTPVIHLRKAAAPEAEFPSERIMVDFARGDLSGFLDQPRGTTLLLGASLTKTLIHWPAGLQRPEGGTSFRQSQIQMLKQLGLSLPFHSSLSPGSPSVLVSFALSPGFPLE